MRRSTESTEITRSEGDFLLQARDLHFSYSATHPVLKDVSFSLQRGTLSALIGANGCGKSTLIRLLAGLIFPARGEITFQGAPLLSFSRRRLARRMAYVPQTQAMIFPFTAFEVVLTALVVTHYLGLLDPTFDYVFALARGAIVAEGTPVAVLTDPILAEVYDDAYVHAGRLDGHTFVWSEA